MMLGCMALWARPPAAWGALGVTVAVGVLGLLASHPLPQNSTRPSLPIWAVVVIGTGAFVTARAIGPPPVGAVTVSSAVAAAIVGIAEEAFFRRLVYGWLLRWGAPAAVGLSALVFAIVHLRAHGVVALPLDLAAGLVFGWQRWACGRWEVPGLTHVAANLLQLW
jgi:membrane protease YdiL (CAAX protease family)